MKNVKKGLIARSRILIAIETQPSEGTAIAKEKNLSYGIVMHHLRLLKGEGIVNRKGRRPYVWFLTGLGQKRLLR
ncbi:hypothetical protein AC478_00485 [miscellaneous Crenarchaeota group-1 archaeon SG8-32-3]|uniref:HTH arsR-type domain-containing protein n=1 Tax=miscellaneous Crenarchaeota group-1 archaeon SG8-32-3 TaxID=1685125 RepID=A0A0M0BVD2_9ARCH|nr:MAG: hypothetical protein AC478_00485 [miscellaneous Crenarchaeota group-1 archaeon SG8-32-3]